VVRFNSARVLHQAVKTHDSVNMLRKFQCHLETIHLVLVTVSPSTNDPFVLSSLFSPLNFSFDAQCFASLHRGEMLEVSTKSIRLDALQTT